MPAPNILLLRTAGTNCDRELAHAFNLASEGQAEVVPLHINQLLANPAQLADCQILGFPGGFSYGDDIASGKILANQLIHHLNPLSNNSSPIGKLILGVCNGFQILVKAGLLPGPIPQLDPADWHPTTLTYNSNGKFQDRWIRVRPLSKLCKWIPQNGPTLDLPIAHGEGRFVTRDARNPRRPPSQRPNRLPIHRQQQPTSPPPTPPTPTAPPTPSPASAISPAASSASCPTPNASLTPSIYTPSSPAATNKKPPTASSTSNPPSTTSKPIKPSPCNAGILPASLILRKPPRHQEKQWIFKFSNLKSKIPWCLSVLVV